MGVELVTDNVPADGLWSGGDHVLQVCQKIGLRAGGSTRGGDHLAGDDIAAQEKAAPAMADRLAFAPLHVARGQGQARVFALEGLHAGHFIVTSRLFPLLCQSGGLLIQRAHGLHCFLAVRILWGPQPRADQMRLEIVVFNKPAAWRGEIWATMPRRMTRLSDFASRKVG